MVDPILKELWEIKDGLSKECNHDLRKLFDKLKESQKKYSDRVVNRAGLKSKAVNPSNPE